MKIVWLLLFGIAFLPLHSTAQQDGGTILPAIIKGKDTLGLMILPEVTIITKVSFKDPEDLYRFNQLRRNIIIVYPYAKQAGIIFKEVNNTLSETDRRHDQKKYLKAKEKELDEQFESKLKDLNTAQGSILFKLIARETGQNCYELIREFKNPVSAFFWQTASRLYGYNLKVTYDPQEDRDIEIIVRSLDNDL
jgi:hypothetical protein